MKHFAVEREGNFVGDVILRDDAGNVAFADLMEMNYDEMKNYEHLEEFVVAMMDATNEVSDDYDGQTFVTLVGEDDIFIWGILIGPGENDDDYLYSLVDWKADGKTYKYMDEEY